MPRKTATKTVLDTPQADPAPEPTLDRFERLQAALDGPVCLHYQGQAIHGTLRAPAEGDTTYDLRVGDHLFRLAWVTAVENDPVNGLTIFLKQL